MRTTCITYSSKGQVPGTLHQCQGQEAVAVGVCAVLRVDDVIFSTHRPVGPPAGEGCLGRGDHGEDLGQGHGLRRGKGGQMHLVDVAVGAMPSNAIVGANIPIAVGRRDRLSASAGSTASP